MRSAELMLAPTLLVVLAACDAPAQAPTAPMASSPATTSSTIMPASTGSAPQVVPSSTAIAPANAARVEIARDVVSATVMRLDKAGAGWNASAPATPSRVAGFSVRGSERGGSERAMGAAELTELLERLRASDGYDDQTMKRCAMDHLVGFRLQTTRGEVVEMAVDFNCQKLFAVYGRARTVHGTHFDPSRAALLALVKRALPGDAEIEKLR